MTKVHISTIIVLAKTKLEETFYMNTWNEYIKAINCIVNRTDYLYEKWAKQQSVNSYLLMILYMLSAADINTQKEIANIYGMPKQTVNTVITDLHKKGYIKLIPNEKDKRSKVIKLTDEGMQYADAIVNPLLSCEKNVLEKMGEKRVGMLIDTMNQYADLLEKEFNKFNNLK